MYPAGCMSKVSLRLFVNGGAPRPRQVIAEVQRLLDARLPEPSQVEIVDVLERPDIAERDRILATPTLVRFEPPPPRRVIGDLGDPEELLAYLLPSEESEEESLTA